MRRKTFDLILTAIGAGVTLMLIVAGGLLMWGYSFANSNVHDQLAMQQITFPTAGTRNIKLTVTEGHALRRGLLAGVVGLDGTAH